MSTSLSSGNFQVSTRKFLRVFGCPKHGAEGLSIASHVFVLAKPPMDYSIERERLEQLLTAEVRKMEPGASSVTVSFDSQFAIYNVGARHIIRRLSSAAKKFLSEGGAIPAKLLDD